MVNPAKEKALLDKFVSLGVRQTDIIESFIRSSGPGGQNVNKTSTCVYLRHLPTGIEVKCQTERSQVMNRYKARVILLEKIGSRMLRDRAERKAAAEKARRQKRRPSKGAKLRNLEAKRKHSAKKSFRKAVANWD